MSVFSVWPPAWYSNLCYYYHGNLMLITFEKCRIQFHMLRGEQKGTRDLSQRKYNTFCLNFTIPFFSKYPNYLLFLIYLRIAIVIISSTVHLLCNLIFFLVNHKHYARSATGNFPSLMSFKKKSVQPVRYDCNFISLGTYTLLHENWHPLVGTKLWARKYSHCRRRED